MKTLQRQMKKNGLSKVIGIDPGKSGGLTVIEKKDVYSQKCPGDVKDMAIMFAIALEQTPPQKVAVFLEKVWAFPTDAKKTAFIFGQNYGQWEGIISSYEIGVSYVTPKEWQSFYDIPKMVKKDRKNHIKKIAKELFPNIKVTLNVSDSILIANYGINILTC